MTAITNTVQTYALRGIREDLSDMIYNIAPTDVPFMSNIGRSTADNTYFEWQTDTLAAASTTNAQIEGDDISSFTAITPTNRMGNYTQIARKDVIVSGTADRVRKAGRKAELAYQITIKTKELKRDLETSILYNQAASAGNSSTARYTAGLPAWIRTNVDKDGGGTNPTLSGTTQGYPNAARGDGTQRSFTETILKNVIQQCWTSGGEPTMIMLGAFNKQAFSAFTGVATKYREVGSKQQAQIIGAADIYVSDFGTLTAVPCRFQRTRDVFVIDPKMASVAYLRPFMTEELAKTGDAEKRMMLVEYGLRVNNEAAHGIAADLTTS